MHYSRGVGGIQKGIKELEENVPVSYIPNTADKGTNRLGGGCMEGQDHYIVQRVENGVYSVAVRPNRGYFSMCSTGAWINLGSQSDQFQRPSMGSWRGEVRAGI